MVDKSTCVQTKAFQNDESLFNLKQGATACINITILCKVGGKLKKKINLLFRQYSIYCCQMEG